MSNLERVLVRGTRTVEEKNLNEVSLIPFNDSFFVTTGFRAEDNPERFTLAVESHAINEGPTHYSRSEMPIPRANGQFSYSVQLYAIRGAD